MSLIRWQRPRRNISTWNNSDDISRVFDEFFNGFGLEPFRDNENAGGFTPFVDISETEKEFHVRAELPGVEEKDFELELNDKILTLKGEKRYEDEKKEKNFYRKETVYGSFVRSIPLPEAVDPDKVEAKFRNGVLDVVLPKTSNTKIKKINVN